MSEEKIRITVDDLDAVEVSGADVARPAARQEPVTEGRQWGTVSGEQPLEEEQKEKGSFLLKSWVYLTLAGGAGALVAWGICEPGFVDGGASHKWGNFLMFPLMTAFMCVAFAVAESVVERSAAKAVKAGLLGLGLGLVLGFVFSMIANVIYTIGCNLLLESGGELTAENPALWLVRAVGWCAFGAAGGVVYGIVGVSWKKTLYGVLGGVLGGALGGLLFDPISLMTDGGGPSRCIGAVIFAAATGAAIGLVEGALKNRWLYVAGGPLAGKQFILYKPMTRLGSQQTNDIYLFKDPSISPLHATIEQRGSVMILQAMGSTFVGGRPVTRYTLRSGDLIQIGRYAFHYQEKK